MRFRIPRSILRAAIAANVFVAASAACYSSIPGNRNNSYQPVGLVDVAEADGLLTFGRIDKLPNFVLYSPVNTIKTSNDSPLAKSESHDEPKPAAHLANNGCEIDQEFTGCWMTCPEEIENISSVSPPTSIEDQMQIGFIDQQQLALWARSSIDAIQYSWDVFGNYAIEAPFDAGEAVAQFYGIPTNTIDDSTTRNSYGNVFVYVIDHAESDEENIASDSPSFVSDSSSVALPKINPFQSGVQDLISEIESSIVSKGLGCGYDPYESCFPNEIANSFAINSVSTTENTRLVSEDDFVPFHLKVLFGQFQDAVADADAGVGHCAVPSADSDIETQSYAMHSQHPSEPNEPLEPTPISGENHDSIDSSVTSLETQWRPNIQAARSLVESWMEPNWDTKQWVLKTRNHTSPIANNIVENHRAPKFRWDAVFGRVDSPMLSEIPIDPSLTLVQDLYPQPTWYTSSPLDHIGSEAVTNNEEIESSTTATDAVTITPKRNSDALVPLARQAWNSIGKAINTQYVNTVRMWYKLSYDSKRILAAQMKSFGSMLLRSADSLEGNIGIAQRDTNPNDGNR